MNAWESSLVKSENIRLLILDTDTPKNLSMMLQFYGLQTQLKRGGDGFLYAGTLSTSEPKLPHVEWVPKTEQAHFQLFNKEFKKNTLHHTLRLLQVWWDLPRQELNFWKKPRSIKKNCMDIPCSIRKWLPLDFREQLDFSWNRIYLEPNIQFRTFDWSILCYISLVRFLSSHAFTLHYICNQIWGVCIPKTHRRIKQ